MEQNNTILYIPCKLMTTAENLQLANAAQLWDEEQGMKLSDINALISNSVRLQEERDVAFLGNFTVSTPTEDGQIYLESPNITLNGEVNINGENLKINADNTLDIKSPIMTLDGEVNVPEYLYVLEDWLMVTPSEGGGTLSLADAYAKKSDVVQATSADIDLLFT